MSLYCMKCKRHVIALLYHYALAIVIEAIVGVTTSAQRRYDGDQGVKPVMMEITTMLWRWRSKAQDDDGHIMSHILIACDVYLFMHLILLSTAVAL